MTRGALSAGVGNAVRPAQKPRFRAEHVGALLPPEALTKARATSGLEPEALAEAEDAAIAAIVAMQQEIGLPVVTDGALRGGVGQGGAGRDSFIAALTGMDSVARPEPAGPDGAARARVHPILADRLDFPEDHPMLAQFRHLASVARVTPRIAIPSPGAMSLHVAKADIAPQAYRDAEVLSADLATVWRKAVAAFYAAGCRYLQVDDSFPAAPHDPAVSVEKAAEARAGALRRHLEMLDAAIADRPADMTVALRMGWGAGAQEGEPWVAALDGDDALVEALFSTGVDVFFFEHDCGRLDGFDALRLLPKGDKRAVLGLVSARSPRLETLDQLKRGFDAAARFVEMEQLALAPGCGFSPSGDAPLTQDDQKRKLDLVVRAADALWGRLDG